MTGENRFKAVHQPASAGFHLSEPGVSTLGERRSQVIL
jgi:hypothetical protein